MATKEFFPGIEKIKFEGKDSKNPMAFRYYDAEKVNEMTRETAYLEGIDKGKLAGEREKQIEIAKSMLKENMDIEMIIKITGLTKQEIEKLQEM